MTKFACKDCITSLSTNTQFISFCRMTASSLHYLTCLSLLQSLITFPIITSDYLLCLITLMAVFLVAHLHQYNLSAWTNCSDLLGELMWTLPQSFDIVNHNSTLALDRACLNKAEFSGTETNQKIVVKFLSQYLFIPLKWIHHFSSCMLYIVFTMTNCQCELLSSWLPELPELSPSL